MNQKTKWPPDLTVLTDLRKKYGIPLLDWAIKEEATPLSTPGPVVYDDKESCVDLLKGEYGQLIDAKGVPYCVYIHDLSFGLDDALEKDLSPRKVHFMHGCWTLNQMEKDGRYGRYQAIYERNLNEGNRLPVVGSQKMLNHRICKNCLSLDKSINSKTTAPDIFNTEQPTNKPPFLNGYTAETLGIAHILETYNGRRPTPTTIGLGDGEYPTNWPQISKRTRSAKSWTCEDCKVDLNKHQNLLDTHHVNGVKSDNKRSNLQVLCKLCHAKQPQHQHYKVEPDDENLIKKLRRDQKRND